MTPHLTNILVVDDNLYNLQVTSQILKEAGYRIGVAQSGMTALKQLHIQKPDLILLDIMMPEMDGIEVCRRIKEQETWCHIPIIFLTAKTQTEDLLKAFEVGGVDYVTKPFQKEEILVRIKTHIDLYLSKRKIEEMNKTRDKLYSIIAHDIKTPFSNIMLIVNALKDDNVKCDSHEYKKILSFLESSTKQTFDLLTNLLTWTKYQSGIIKPDLSEKNLNVFIMETIQLLQPVAYQKKLSFDLDIQDEFFVYVDAVTIKTIIRNILTNAIKFSHENSMIHIKTKLLNGYKKMIIKDDGVGMTEEVLDRVFKKDESFTQVGTNNEVGNGLGMQMVKDFVKLNKSDMAVTSRVNMGTEVTITFANYLGN